jgi:hypothetical protein
MKRVLVLLLLALVAGAAAYMFWPRQPATTSAPQAAANHAPRGLSADEEAAFLPQICAGASAGSGGYQHNCASLPGYPSADVGGAGLGLGLTLTSVTYGQLTAAGADEAYVSYQGSFEPHADNFGGGILFHRQGSAWQLAGWYPGGAVDHCLSLTLTGRARLLCLFGFTGQGETDSMLALVSIPSGGSLALAKVLMASDLRGTMDPEGNCGLRTSADQAVLLGISGLASAANGASAQVEYVPAAQAASACAAKRFASAATQKATLALAWDGSALTISPSLTFAPAERN